MTLALILFVWFSSFFPAGQAQSPSADSSSSQSTGQQTTPPQPSSASPANPAPQTQKPATKKRKHKKATSDCASAPPTATQNATSTDPAGTATGDQKPPQNCPPSKVIVRQGGTSEPSIQLAGDQPSEERNAVNQMLGATDANLKKLAGQQLNANQQDMVNQVKQFMQQSKNAMNGGDFERARTLAWKAQLLSEELAKPAK